MRRSAAGSPWRRTARPPTLLLVVRVGHDVEADLERRRARRSSRRAPGRRRGSRSAWSCARTAAPARRRPCPRAARSRAPGQAGAHLHVPMLLAEPKVVGNALNAGRRANRGRSSTQRTGVNSGWRRPVPGTLVGGRLGKLRTGRLAHGDHGERRAQPEHEVQHVHLRAREPVADDLGPVVRLAPLDVPAADRVAARARRRPHQMDAVGVGPVEARKRSGGEGWGHALLARKQISGARPQ